MLQKCSRFSYVTVSWVLPASSRTSVSSLSFYATKQCLISHPIGLFSVWLLLMLCHVSLPLPRYCVLAWAENSISFLLTSSRNLLILTFNRFLSVYSSFRYPALMTTERAMRLQFVPWSIAAIFSGLSIWSNQEGIPHMIYVKNLYYTINILMISAFNVYMFKKARDKRIDDEQHGVASPKNRLLKRKYILLIRLLIVNLTFFGSCIPMMIVFFIYPTKESRQSTSYVRKVIWCYFAVLLNAFIHPLVYAVKLPIFVRHLNKLKENFFSRAT